MLSNHSLRFSPLSVRGGGGGGGGGSALARNGMIMAVLGSLTMIFERSGCTECVEV